MEGSQKSELCNKCGEYLIPNVYHECKTNSCSEVMVYNSKYNYNRIIYNIIKEKLENLLK